MRTLTDGATRPARARTASAVAWPVTLAAATLLLAGCFGSSTSDGSRGDPGPVNTQSGNQAPPPQPAPAAFRALFQPGQGVLPYPTDLFFNGSTDGTLNAPASAFTPNVGAVNALDGFSVNGDITVRFSGAIDPASLTAPGAITVLETTQATVISGGSLARIPVGVRRPLVPGTDYTASLSTAVDAGGQVLTIRPLRPLTPSTGGRTNPPSPPTPPGTVDVGGVGYLVVLTSAIRSAGGVAAAPDTDYLALRTVIGTPNPANPTANCAAIPDPTTQGLCNLTAPHLLIAAGAGIPLQNVVLTFSFTTQSTRDVLVQMATAIRGAATPAPIVAQPLPRPGGGILTVKNILDPAGTNPALTGNANVWAGTITLPYYLGTPADATAANPTPPLTSQWQSAAPFTIVTGATGTRFVTRYNPTPAPTRTAAIPLLVTVPNALPKPPGGWPAVIFIHGLGGNRSNALAIAESYAAAGFVVAAIDQPLHGITPQDASAGLRIAGVQERTFDVNYVNNQTRQPPADALVDDSGTHFINIPSVITSRDNLRQSVVDILALARALPSLELDALPGGDIDPTRIHYAGQSLGGIVGATTASLPSDIVSFALSVPGGGISRLLLDSATFGPSIGGAVAANLGNNTLLFNVFFRDAQAAADAGDPLNHFAQAVQNKPILLHRVVGDTVVPNSATDRLVAVGGLSKATGAGAWPADSWVNFTAGTHASLLSPGNTAAVTAEMQRQFVTFVLGGGTGFQIVDASAVEP